MSDPRTSPWRHPGLLCLAIAAAALLSVVAIRWMDGAYQRAALARGSFRSALPVGSINGADDSQSGAGRTSALSASALDESGIEGRGGSGIHEAERRAGVWFPVRAAGEGGAETDPGQAALTRIPLYITSPSPPRYHPGEQIGYGFQAIGGAPPYRWSTNLGVEGFRIDSATGWFSGTSSTPFVAVLEVYVEDTEGTKDSARYYLTVGEAEKLRILTAALPDGLAGEPYQLILEATGGVDPYQWSAPLGLPEDFLLDSSTGVLSGQPVDGVEENVLLRVSDLGGAIAEGEFPLRIHSTLEITTPAKLRPASPGVAYGIRFEAAGGKPPLEWAIEDGSLPSDDRGQSWSLTSDGELQGIAPRRETIFSFVIAVRDTDGRVDRKRVSLPVRPTLIVVPSREKAGLAWHPDDVAEGLGQRATGYLVTRTIGLPTQSADSRLAVYRGTGTNFVDHNLTPGVSYTYTLYVEALGIDLEEYAQTPVTILPFTEGRGLGGVRCDPHVDLVKTFRPLKAGGHGANFAPFNVTGPPDGRGTYAPAAQELEILSLHATASDGKSAAGGQVILAFEDNIVEAGPGEDFTVFENVFFIGGSPDRRYMEPAIVSVALFEGEWYRFPVDVVPPAATSSTPATMDPFYYNRGFAGRNATTGDNPMDPSRSGGDSFDLANLGKPELTWIRYIRLESPGHEAMRDDDGRDWIEHTNLFGALSGQGTSGFDLDAITAIHP